jgi:hypothetical protein
MRIGRPSCHDDALQVRAGANADRVIRHSSLAGRGRGVLEATIRWGLQDWGWLRLEWRCNSNNLASRRCAEKAGMLRGAYDEITGGRRDTVCYGLCHGDRAGRSG